MDENHRPSPAKQPSATPTDPKPARALYSSKLGGDGKARALQQNVGSPSPTTRQAPVAQQKAWAAGAKNPLTGRSSQTPPPNNLAAANNSKQQQPSPSSSSPTSSLREGQRVRISLHTGAEFEGIYANNQADPSSFSLRMVQQRMANGASKRDQANMTFSRKDVADARPVGGNANKNDAKGANGNRPGFRTDSAISTGRQAGERVLQPWVPDGGSDASMSLEQSSSGDGRPWDQFAANERLFNVKTNYHENIYTTTIDKSHPQYKERLAAAEKKAREIERSAPATAHVAEERVMDYAGGDDKKGDEEDKYSGVRRQDVAPLQGRENKYTPPARRAPAAQATSYGAPVDPAIISAQLKGGQGKKTPAPKQDEVKTVATPVAKPPTPQAQPTETKPAESKTEPKAETKPSETKPAEKTGDAKAAAPLRPSAATARTVSPQGKNGVAAPSATSTVEHDVLKEFKNFAIQQRVQAEKVRTSKAKADAHVKLQELKKFADSFKLSTPVPSDLISIIAKDPAKQKAIQEKALQNAEEVAKSKTAPKEKEAATPAKEPVKAAKDQPAAANASAPHAAPDNRGAPRPGGPQHTPTPPNQNQRHQGNRQSYAPGYGNNPQFRGDNRASGQYGVQGRQQVGGNLGERLRRVEQERHSRPQIHPGPDQRPPPTGPASAMPYDRRMPAMQPHVQPKLNPNSHEFRPNPFATTFNPNMAGPSNGSSPRPEVHPPPVAGQLIRRKTKAIDAKKCYILSHIKTFQPPQSRNWDENEGLRPSYDTLPTWRQLKDDEKSDSTMHMTYSEYLEKMPYSGGALSTPNPPHSHPQMAHQHQLPFHLQHGAHNLAPRQSPHMPPMQMHGGQHGHVPHVPFNGSDDHRMMHSNSAQSYASPRISQVPIGYPPPTMGSPAQIPYNQGVMPPFMPGTPQMNNFRSFSNTPQYMPQQNAPMTVPLMQSQFLPAPNGLVAGGPQMAMYAGAHQQFVPHGGAAPPQPIPGSTGGYPSPGRPAAPMMAQQGSQQGQPPMYGVSPNMQFQQPVFPSGHPGNMNMRGGYNGGGPQQYGTSPQQMHNYGNQHRNNSYGGNNHKNFQNHGQGPQQNHQIPSGPQARQADGPEEAK